LPKKKIEKPQREVTKRQLSHWQRESRIQRLIMIGGLIVVVAVLAVVGTGIYMNKYKPYQAAAIKVDNKNYSMDYYIDVLSYLGTLNGSAQLIPYMTDMTVTLIEQNYFYVFEAAKQYGISVSDDEVKAELEKNKLTGNTARNDFARAQLLATKLKDHFDKTTVPAAGDQRNVEAMFLESQTQVNDVKTRISNGEAFGDIAAQLSLESKSKEKRGDFGSVPKGILPDVIDNADTNILEDKVFSADIVPNELVTLADPDRSKQMGYWLVKSTDEPVTPAEGATPVPTATALTKDEVHVMAMLLNSQEKALEIKGLLEKGGEGNDFKTLAKANSQYTNATEDGGDMGILTKDKIKSDFGDTVVALFFNDDPSLVLPLNKISDPVVGSDKTTKGGIWLLKVSELENKAIEGENRDILIKNELQKWQTQVWNDNQDKVETVMTEEQKTWAVSEATARVK
jgi:parvulin-like peptidyl-prolyl isomerase